MENGAAKRLWLILLGALFGIFLILYFVDFMLYNYAKGKGEGGIVYLVSPLVHFVVYPVMFCTLFVFLLIGASGKRPIRPVLQVIALIVLFDSAKAVIYEGEHPFYSFLFLFVKGQYHSYQADRDPPYSETDTYNPDDHVSGPKYMGNRPFLRNKTTTAELWRTFYAPPYLSLTYPVPRYVNISSHTFYYDRLIAYRFNGSTEFILHFYQNTLVHCAYFPEGLDIALPAGTECTRSGEKEKQIEELETLAYCFQRNRSFQIVHRCSEKAGLLKIP